MTVGIESNESDQADECLARLGGLVLSLESVLNDCTRKYRNKFEIEELYSQLNVKLSKYWQESSYINDFYLRAL